MKKIEETKAAEELFNNYMNGQIGLANAYTKLMNAVFNGSVSTESPRIKEIIESFESSMVHAFLVDRGYDIERNKDGNISYTYWEDPEFPNLKDHFTIINI